MKLRCFALFLSVLSFFLIYESNLVAPAQAQDLMAQHPGTILAKCDTRANKKTMQKSLEMFYEESIRAANPGALVRVRIKMIPYRNPEPALEPYRFSSLDFALSGGPSTANQPHGIPVMSTGPNWFMPSYEYIHPKASILIVKPGEEPIKVTQELPEMMAHCLWEGVKFEKNLEASGEGN